MDYRIDYCCLSDTGRVRRQNQDNLYFPGHRPKPEAPLEGGMAEGSVFASAQPVFGVFDGMGGEARGEMAAWIAAQAASRFGFSDPDGFESFCREANRRVCAWAEAHHVGCMGTTAALLRFSAGEVGICGLGDSRVYCWRSGALHQLTRDHVYPAAGGRKPPLVQFLGIPEDQLRLEPCLAAVRPEPGDRFLACSDGLTDMVPARRIAEALAAGSAREAAESLMALALEAGGRDNITLMLCDIEKEWAPCGGVRMDAVDR